MHVPNGPALASAAIISVLCGCGPLEEPRQAEASAGASGAGAAAVLTTPNGAVLTDLWETGGTQPGAAALGGGSGWEATGGAASSSAPVSAVGGSAGGATGSGGAATAPAPVSTGGRATSAATGGVNSGTGQAATGGSEAGEQPGTGGLPDCQSQLGEAGCNLVTLCGCAEGERCAVSADGSRTECTAAGSIGAYYVGCQDGSDCQPGLGCLFHPAAVWGACFPFCDTLADCPNPDGVCLNLGPPGVNYCMPNCDPREPQNNTPPFAACGPGAACTLDTANAASYCTGESNADSQPGQFCETSIDCAPGHVCVDWTCMRYCLIGADDCSELGRTVCSELSRLASGDAFGYCAGGWYVARDLPLSVYDLTTAGSVLTVPDDFVLSRVMVEVSIQHDYCADLRLSLVGPDGSSILLVERSGSDAEDCYTETHFDDSAPVGIAQVSPPYVGAFRPEQALSAFVGQSSAGDWALVVEDQSSGDEGQLVGWTLTLW
jgi:subtilisin-like proprotein convertase family protein